MQALLIREIFLALGVDDSRDSLGGGGGECRTRSEICLIGVSNRGKYRRVLMV